MVALGVEPLDRDDLLPAATSATVTEQERTATPPRCTVQAPQSPLPQPNLVPVRPSSSRMTQSSGIDGIAVIGVVSAR